MQAVQRSEKDESSGTELHLGEIQSVVSDALNKWYCMSIG